MGWTTEQVAGRTLCAQVARIARHEPIQGEYRILSLAAPEICALARPGQFLHVLIPTLADAVLRRPFSIYRAEDNCVSVLYKPVGRGTRAMLSLAVGDTVDVIGPLGNGYPVERRPLRPVLVAGGYGMAALYLVARALGGQGSIFMGGAQARDILCVADFEALGWQVRVTTVDGSLGHKGLVTDALDAWLAELPADAAPEYFACGPNGMLRAVGDRAIARGETAWLSVDRHMGCGVGACLVCVQKVRAPHAPDGWEWARVCTEGPVFESREVLWDA